MTWILLPLSCLVAAPIAWLEWDFRRRQPANKELFEAECDKL